MCKYDWICSSQDNAITYIKTFQLVSKCLVKILLSSYKNLWIFRQVEKDFFFVRLSLRPTDDAATIRKKFFLSSFLFQSHFSNYNHVIIFIKHFSVTKWAHYTSCLGCIVVMDKKKMCFELQKNALR